MLWVWWITVALSRFAGNAVRYYSRKVTGAQSVTSLTQKLVQMFVVSLGIVWILKVVFNLSLTPLVTAFGVGGLAVALALQDTLSNLFAGFYVSISGLVRLGDYIKLSTAEEGYVTDINWRCTTMRTLTNNLVVIPNNKLGQTNFTNYNLPESRMSLSVSVSVAYDSISTAWRRFCWKKPSPPRPSSSSCSGSHPPPSSSTPDPATGRLYSR